MPLQAQEEAELESLRQAKARALAQRDVQLQQLEQLKARIVAEQEQNLREGLMIKQQAAEEAERLRQKVSTHGCDAPCPKLNWVCVGMAGLPKSWQEGCNEGGYNVVCNVTSYGWGYTCKRAWRCTAPL